MEHILKEPLMGKGNYIHPTALLIGNVEIGDDCSFWPYSVTRGDEDRIEIGNRTNVQDGVIIHVDKGYPVKVGDNVTIGHGAVIHGCEIAENCIIGIRSVILNGSKIGKGSIIAAGAVITPGTIIPPYSMVLGIPGKVKKTDPEIEDMALENARVYVDLGKEYLKKGSD
jgi:carbonic anhydrase/acetyltransferase-like protein (isoleucine patch superfamily)